LRVCDNDLSKKDSILLRPAAEVMQLLDNRLKDYREAEKARKKLERETAKAKRRR
jgi:hypothetical protein